MVKTKLLYFNDNYQTHFVSQIADIFVKQGAFILAETLFYPRGGNQDSDRGQISINNDIFPIINVTKDKKTHQVLHTVSEEVREKLDDIELDDEITGQINWERRYQLMKIHTSQHLLSSLFTKHFDVQTIDVEISEDQGEIVLDDKLSYDALLSVQQQANNLITKHLPTKRTLVNDRFHIEIGTVDDRECGGTHVNNLSEIGKIVISDYSKNKLIFKVDSDAKKAEYQQHIESLKLRQLYPQGISSIEDFDNYLNSLQEENARQKERVRELAHESIQVKLAQEESINEVSLTLIDCPELTTKEIKKLIGQHSSEREKVIICICKNNSLVITSNTTPTASDIMALCKKHDSNVKGGGSPIFAQGGPWNSSIEEIRGMLTSSLS
jgi:alanyl-tRNA synthetase